MPIKPSENQRERGNGGNVGHPSSFHALIAGEVDTCSPAELERLLSGLTWAASAAAGVKRGEPNARLRIALARLLLQLEPTHVETSRRKLLAVLAAQRARISDLVEALKAARAQRPP